MRGTLLSAALLCLIAVVAAAKPASAGESNQLSLYTCFVESENDAIFRAFERDTGIKIKYVRLSSGEALTRLIAEGNNPQVSLLLGGAVDTHINATNAGILANYVSKNIDAVDPAFHDPKGIFTPLSIVITAFVSNEGWLKENNLQPPTSWEEILGDAFRENVCMAHPATSGAAYTAFSSVLQLFGEDAGFDYLKKLDRNIVQYTKAGAAPMRMAGLDEVGVAIGYDLDGASLREEGYPLVISYPKEGTGYEVTCTSLVKGGPADEVANAQRFVDWILEPRTQRMLTEEFFRIPVNQNVEMPEGRLSLAEIKTIAYDSEWSGKNKPRLVERFENEVRSKEGVK